MFHNKYDVLKQKDQLLHKLDITYISNYSEKENMRRLILISADILSDSTRSDLYFLVDKLVQNDLTLLNHYSNNQ